MRPQKSPPGRAERGRGCRAARMGVGSAHPERLQRDPTVAALPALAVEFEAKAVALTAEEASAKQVDQLDPKLAD